MDVGPEGYMTSARLHLGEADMPLGGVFSTYAALHRSVEGHTLSC